MSLLGLYKQSWKVTMWKIRELEEEISRLESEK